MAAARKSGDTTPRPVQIQRVAADLFFTHGYEGTSIREIADALGIRSASLYYHYAGKEQILFDLIRSTMDQLTSVARAMIEREATPEGKLAALVIQHLVMHALRPRQTTLGDTELRSLTGEQLETALAMRDRHEQLFTDTIRQGVEAGVFDVPDVPLAAYAVIAQCNHVGIWFDAAGRLPLAEVARVYALYALRVVAGPALSESDLDELTSAAIALHEEWQ
jgi:AcrR family transcriptional regulator